jgi:hypothetical protein
VINRYRTKHRDELAESQHGIPLAPMHQLERDAGLDPASKGFATHEYSRSQMLIMRSLEQQYHWIYLDPGTGSLRPQTALENYVRERMYQKMIAAMTRHCATFLPSQSDQSAHDVGRLFDMVMTLEGETDFDATMAITARLTNGTMFKSKSESLQEWLTRFNDLCQKLAEVESALSQKQRAQYMISFVNHDGRYRRTIFDWQEKARFGQPATVQTLVMALQLRANELHDVPTQTAKKAAVQGTAANANGRPTKSNNAKKSRKPQSSGEPCRNFAAGNCKFGDKCWNVHDAKAHATKGRREGNKEKQPCFNWQKGDCKFGDGCRYAHDPKEKGTKTHEQPKKANAEDKIADSVKAQLGGIECPNKKQTGNCHLDPCPFAHQAHVQVEHDVVADYQTLAAFATAAHYHGNGSTNFEPAMAPQPQSYEAHAPQPESCETQEEGGIEAIEAHALAGVVSSLNEHRRIETSRLFNKRTWECFPCVLGHNVFADKSNSAIFDSGANFHMFPDSPFFRERCSDIKPMPTVKIYTAGKNARPLVASGSATFFMQGQHLDDGEGVLLPHSLLVEGLSRPLISVPTLDKQGYGFLTLSEHAYVLKENEIIISTPLGALPDAPDLYGVPLDWFVNTDQQIAAAAEALLSKTTTNVEAEYLRFHRAIGHRNMRETTRLYNELLSGTLPYDFSVDCDSCPAAKMTKTSFAKQYRIKATHVGHTLSFDGYGPYKILSPSRDRSGLVVVDNNSKYIFHSMHKYRSEYGPQCRWTVMHAINVHGRVCYTRSDNEFVTNENKDLFQAKGIQALPTAPASSESNGQAERTIRTIRESGRAMRHRQTLRHRGSFQLITMRRTFSTSCPARTRRVCPR